MNKNRILYVSVLTDFGFKKFFSDERTMRSFLNAILSEDYGQIDNVTFVPTELPPDDKDGRGVTFDLRCKASDGTDILIEMQNYSQRLFKTRSNYYLCRLMNRYIQAGFDWSREDEIPKMVGVFVLARPISGIDKLITRTSECDLDSHKEFWDRMRKYFIMLPQFEEEKCQQWTKKEAWIDVIKNMGTENDIDPRVYEVADKELLDLIEKAKVSALSPEERDRYESELRLISESGSAEWCGYERGVIEMSEKLQQKDVEIQQKDEEIQRQKEEIQQQKEEMSLKNEAIQLKDEAIQQKDEAIARMVNSLKCSGFSIDQIANIANLSIEEIKEIMG